MRGHQHLYHLIVHEYTYVTFSTLPSGSPSPSSSAEEDAQRKKRKTSDVWDHFDETPDGFKCKYCPKSYQKKTSTGNLDKHITNNHITQTSPRTFKPTVAIQLLVKVIAC
eukprot:TRINITY_DN9495_c0_g1_i4.p1 TRINITY_DN9495_c0_g1~~TRINITY_DN9495_c0_g1_i4.p1  ORF type:complete len:110 (+),score=22.17 TRINITY_DN9495_c0_g1_i4:35-364(+)